MVPPTNDFIPISTSTNTSRNTAQSNYIAALFVREVRVQMKILVLS
jgi:hypothetical protein